LEFADPGGQILFGGVDVTAKPIEKRQVGMVFQSYALFPNMNVTENIEYGLRVRGIDKATRRQQVADMLDMFSLQPYATRHVDQLSGGQRQRVALARAIITRPQVLLLDEPLSALDAQLKKRLRSEINTLLKNLGITAIYVTHDQEEAMVMGDRIAVLDQGAIVQLGTAEEIYLAPRSEFVADFIGQMNYLTGELAGDNLKLSADHLLPLSGHAARTVKSNGTTTLMIRPEDIRLESPEIQGLPGVVLSSVFLGDRTRVMAGVGETHAPVCVDCFARRHYQVQQRVSLVIDQARIVWLKGEQTC
jgi:putative spermidine/putrescine transport system ATP-binding protein